MASNKTLGFFSKSHLLHYYDVFSVSDVANDVNVSCKTKKNKEFLLFNVSPKANTSTNCLSSNLIPKSNSRLLHYYNIFSVSDVAIDVNLSCKTKKARGFYCSMFHQKQTLQPIVCPRI